MIIIKHVKTLYSPLKFLIKVLPVRDMHRRLAHFPNKPRESVWTREQVGLYQEPKAGQTLDTRDPCSKPVKIVVMFERYLIVKTVQC